MNLVMKIVFGSHLYGTSTLNSDFDFKTIFIPEPRDIILGTGKEIVVTKRDKMEGEKNYAGEEETESISLKQYLKLLSEGQTMAIDMLFAPFDMHVEQPTTTWSEIYINRHRLLTKKSKAFVGYCFQQASKYGIKGSRVASARAALNALSVMYCEGSFQKLKEFHSAIEVIVSQDEHMSLVPVKQIEGTELLHWEVCGKKLSYNASVKSAYDIVKNMVDQYGQRALLAEKK